MIIKSLLETDLYKYTMGQVALHQFSNTQVEYEFKCRNSADWQPHHLKRIKDEVAHYCSLSHTKDELDYLRSIRFFKDSYIDFLKLYRPDPEHFNIRLEDGELKINIKGPWFITVYYEVPLLAIVNEVYFEDYRPDEKAGYTALDNKLDLNNKHPFKFVDFGTRRRFSRDWHRKVVEYLKKHCANFVGTSNVAWAMEFGLKPIGTMAHEFFQIGQGLPNVTLAHSQRHMLQCWSNEYRGDLGIALTDIIGIDAFLRDFDLYFAKLYDGVRHDSGDPFEWGERMIAHYAKNRVDPHTKTLIFSDQLSFPLAIEIARRFHGRARTAFGIGTNLTNDLGYEPLNIVIKMTECNGQPVAKVSDSPGKTVSKDARYLAYLRQVFGLAPPQD